MLGLQIFGYNVDVAKIFGVCTSVFLSCIDIEYDKQFRTNQLNANNTMSLSRSEIYERTGLDDEKQLDVELSLKECNVLITKPVKNVPNKNYYILDKEQLFKILNASNPSDVISSEKAKQFIHGKRVEPVSKRQTHITQLKKKVNVEDPVLQDYFIQWIDAVYSNPKGFLSPSGVVFAQQELLEYAKGNQAKQLDIIKIAIKGGMRDITWAIQDYEKINHIDTRNFVNYSDIKADKNDVDTSEVF